MALKLALSRAGINRASLFPDLDGIAGHINWLHKWGIRGRPLPVRERRIASKCSERAPTIDLFWVTRIGASLICGVRRRNPTVRCV